MPPLFYTPDSLAPNQDLDLGADNARHIVQVLRMAVGDALCLTDGRGRIADCVIKSADKRRCVATVLKTADTPKHGPSLALAIAFTKHAGRNEWLLEKAAELGVDAIYPVAAQRAEKMNFRWDRWQGILIAAMIQSQQAHLTQIHAAQDLLSILDHVSPDFQVLLAHCAPDLPRTKIHQALAPGTDTLIFVGPEGDFTHEEIALAQRRGVACIDLGQRRLRTETAAIAACAYFRLLNA